MPARLLSRPVAPAFLILCCGLVVQSATAGPSTSPVDHAAHHAQPATNLGLRFTTHLDPARPRAEEPFWFSYRFTNPDGSAPDLMEMHTKLSHLIVVSEDLSYFDHLHPEQVDPGKFMIQLSLPAGGDYVLYADATPQGGTSQVERFPFHLAGEAAAGAPLDLSPMETTAGKYTVHLSMEPESLTVGEATLTFHLSKDGKPAADLQPYLGAGGHLVVISGDTSQFLHAHPMEDAGGGDHEMGGSAMEGPGMDSMEGMAMPGMMESMQADCMARMESMMATCMEQMDQKPAAESMSMCQGTMKEMRDDAASTMTEMRSHCQMMAGGGSDMSSEGSSTGGMAMADSMAGMQESFMTRMESMMATCMEQMEEKSAAEGTSMCKGTMDAMRGDAASTMAEMRSRCQMSGDASGSVPSAIAFMVAFPTAGRYKAWGQFLNSAGEVIIAPFVIDVH